MSLYVFMILSSHCFQSYFVPDKKKLNQNKIAGGIFRSSDCRKSVHSFPHMYHVNKLLEPHIRKSSKIAHTLLLLTRDSGITRSASAHCRVGDGCESGPHIASKLKRR